jgi:hypothetical protein
LINLTLIKIYFFDFQAFSASPTPVSLMRYTVGTPLSNDASNATVPMNENLTIAINQLSPGPFTNMYVSFGDGTPMQNCTLMASKTATCQLIHVYTSGGTFTVEATPDISDSNATVQINNMTVTVVAPFAHIGMMDLVNLLT